tara:strand:+ start:2698 stop:3450 length:753 start_codon:yes stop_codon:yes gene_type:complete
MSKISGVIITFNEEKYIEKCLASLVGVVDEIVVVDSYSTDKTKEICEKYNVVFIEQKFLGYLEQKNFALEKTSYEYALSLDGDEALSKELQQHILSIKDNLKYDGYQLNRLNSYCGKWVKHSNWYPDTRIRLLKKGTGKWVGKNPHDFLELNKGGTLGKLNGDLLHWAYDTYSEHFLKVNNFTDIAAKSHIQQNKKKVGYFKIFINPTWKFFKNYFIRLGFLDGFTGFIICSFEAFGTFVKYIKIKELQD